MNYPIENKLVIAIASSAIFDLSESDQVFREEGEEKYKEYQRKHKNIPLKKGVAFPFIRRFLNLNKVFPNELPVEVILLSRNAPETGLRVLNSIREYNLKITRAAFLSGKSPYPYIPAFNVSLFLSANPVDVKHAIDAQYPAGIVMPSYFEDCEQDQELRVAFDFDGVIADDEAETIFQQHKNLEEFHTFEQQKANIALKPGPLNNLFVKLSLLQKLEKQRELQDKSYSRLLRTAIISARGAPAHERLVTTLTAWGVEPDETFFLGGMDKLRILEILKPHIFFDDQLTHLKSSAKKIPSVHIPFGIINQPLP
jgi:5'-nucleotidase